MRKRAMVSILAMAFIGSALASGGGDDHAPMHGGVVSSGKEMDFELVAKPDTLHLYFRDHGKAIDPSKAMAKVTLLSGSEKTEVELKPSGNKLEAKGRFKVGPGTKAVAVVMNEGKSLGTIRFLLK